MLSKKYYKFVYKKLYLKKVILIILKDIQKYIPINISLYINIVYL